MAVAGADGCSKVFDLFFETEDHSQICFMFLKSNIESLLKQEHAFKTYKLAYPKSHKVDIHEFCHIMSGEGLYFYNIKSFDRGLFGSKLYEIKVETQIYPYFEVLGLRVYYTSGP